MKHTLTFLENSTIITWSDGEVAIIDVNLEGWIEWAINPKWLEYMKYDADNDYKQRIDVLHDVSNKSVDYYL